MLSVHRTLRHAASAALLLAGLPSTASIINPSNDTIPNPSSLVNITVWYGSVLLAPEIVYPLSNAAQNVQTSPLYGYAHWTTSNDQLDLGNSNIAFIPCDSSASFVNPSDLYASAVGANVTAIVFFSKSSNWCSPQANNSLTFPNVFTMTTRNDTAALLYGIKDNAVAWNVAVGGDRQNVSTTSSTSSTGPAPGTALAMIILYAITGTITALFILIIITGTVRAHRHPERYGPRTVNGQVKRSRAGGLARAMLDTIPVVKFGDRAPPKQGDIELGQSTTATQQPATKQATVTTQPARDEVEGGIAAASSSVDHESNSLGCSICTDDFEHGQDQRVLPCGHCFHPSCVDPWLLNVSGTCPLCRVDLRSPEQEEAEAQETTPAAAPPRRRSVFLAITGFRRLDGMTRDERLQALRQYRSTQQNDPHSQEPQTEAGAARSPESEPAIEDAGRTRRLLRLFNVRTRRT